MDVSETSRLTLVVVVVVVRDGVRTAGSLPLIAPFGIESKAIPQIDHLRMQPVCSAERRLEGNRIVRADACVARASSRSTQKWDGRVLQERARE